MGSTGVSARAWQARMINTLKYPILQRILGLLRIDLLRNITPFDARCMVILIVVPAVWKLLSDDFGARLVVVAALFYVSTYYLLAGISKLQFAWNWPLVVRTGNYYPASFIWHAQDMPPLLDAVAGRASATFQRYPGLDIASAFVVLLEQFLWLLAPFSLIRRIHAGVFAALYHVAVLATTGIVFVTWPFIALAVTLPFTRIAKSFGVVSNEPGRSDLQVSLRMPQQWTKTAAVAGLSVLAAVLPSGVAGGVFPPFYNYAQFGWRYQNADEFTDVYRVGWRHPATGTIEAFPLNQGGFLEFRHTAIMDAYTRLILATQPTPATDEIYGRVLATLLDGTRGPNANGWLLGRFQAPAHLIGHPGLIDMQTIETFYLMKGRPLPRENGRPIKVGWTLCGEINRVGLGGARAFTRFDGCRDP